MALFSRQYSKHVDPADMLDNLSDQIALLRKELESVRSAVRHYGGDTLEDVQHNALALAREVRQGGKVVARNLSKQASVAGKVVQDNPVPVVVALGTIALLSTLLLTRD
jgi:ElaB/YqjD/DUF883 family membrane-anchored ribosome-binding protein